MRGHFCTDNTEETSFENEKKDLKWLRNRKNDRRVRRSLCSRLLSHRWRAMKQLLGAICKRIFRIAAWRGLLGKIGLSSVSSAGCRSFLHARIVAHAWWCPCRRCAGWPGGRLILHRQRVRSGRHYFRFQSGRLNGTRRLLRLSTIRRKPKFAFHTVVIWQGSVAEVTPRGHLPMFHMAIVVGVLLRGVVHSVPSIVSSHGMLSIVGGVG
jgi:hypothetical protein